MQQYPSLYGMKCPECKEGEFKILGIGKSSSAAEAGIVMLSGAVGNFVMDKISNGESEIKPVKYKCLKCKKKFLDMPGVAEEGEALDEPCVVTFHRLSSVVGLAVSQQVYLNGIKMGNVKNNSSISFDTHTKHNTVFVTDQYGVAFPGRYDFVAESGGAHEINFKRKFVLK